MISIEYRSQENGKRMSRSEGSSFGETLTKINTRVSYKMIGLMARESQHLLADQSTRETIKMEIRKGLASTLIIVGTNMMAAGTRIICME